MKRNLWKRAMAMSAAGMLILGMTGTSVAAETEEKGGYSISFMLAQSSYKEDAHLAIKEKMKEKYDIDVEYEVIPDAQFTNLSQVRISTGEAPDIIHVNVPGAYTTYDAESTLLPLDDQPWMERLSLDSGILKADDEKVYSMPITGFSGVMGVIYNKDVFSDLGIEVPQTYEAFLKALETVKNAEKDITPLYLSFKDTWTSQIGPMIYFANALNENCDSVYEKLNKNEQKFSDVEEFKQALADFQKLFSEGYINEDFSVGTYDTSKEEVANGQAAMILSGEYAVNDILTNWPDANIGMFPLPYNDVEKIMTAQYVYGLVIPKDAPDTENAKDFLNKISQPEFLSLYLNANSVNSPFKDVASDNINAVLQEMYDTYLNTGNYVVQVGDILSNFGSLNDDIIFPAYAQLALGEDLDNVIGQIDNGMLEYGKNLGCEGF
ncbi:MAG: ABC transporter substrate-binding protein [Eubacteriales bacterium]|nr:ABC transporter substrate-binding protein [Eubacteriales bacterium]